MSSGSLSELFGLPFVKWFAHMLLHCCLSCPVCDIRVLWPNSWMDQDATWYRGRPQPRPQGYIVLDGDPARPPKGAQPPVFGPCLLWPNGWMGQDANWYEGRPRLRRHCVRWGPSSTMERGTAVPHFLACVCCSQTVAHLSYC